MFGHQDFEYVLPGNIKATFLWAPYGTNLTAHFKAWCDSPPALSLAPCRFKLAVLSGASTVVRISQLTCVWQG